MSYKLTEAVWQCSKAKHADLLVLLALAEWANGPKNECWHSLDDIVQRTRLSEKQVCRSLTSLEEIGEIRRDRSLGGWNRRTHYFITLTSCPVAIAKRKQTDETNSDILSESTLTSCPPNSDISSETTLTSCPPNSDTMSEALASKEPVINRTYKEHIKRAGNRASASQTHTALRVCEDRNDVSLVNQDPAYQLTQADLAVGGWLKRQASEKGWSLDQIAAEYYLHTQRPLPLVLLAELDGSLRNGIAQ